MKIYPRKIEQELKKQLNSKEIIVLTGMRRTGKTTLMRNIFNGIESSNKVYLDLENPLNRKIFEEANYDNIWDNLKPMGVAANEKSYIFLDEIQLMAEIPGAIKYLFDHYNVKFFLTGSSSYYLRNLFPESLAGRKFIFELYPLDFEEYLWFKEKAKSFEADFSLKAQQKNEVQFEMFKKYYDEYVRFGGFPGVVLEENFEQKTRKLNDIFTSYFEQDVKALADFKNTGKLRDLIILLAARAGSKLEITKISKELAISRETVYNYISFLEKTYFIKLIRPFSRNSDREVSGARKIYFCDTGILNMLDGASAGSVFENAVLNNLGRFKKINYFQKRTGAEIDFVLDQSIGLEVKEQGNKFNYFKLKKLAQRAGLKEAYVASKKFSADEGIILAMDL